MLSSRVIGDSYSVITLCECQKKRKIDENYQQMVSHKQLGTNI